MKNYLKVQMNTLIDPDSRIKFISITIGLIGPWFMEFILTPAVGTVLVLWCLDFFFGCTRAIMAGQFHHRRTLWSAMKLALYIGLLLFGFFLRWGLGGYVGAGVFAVFVSAVIMTEASSVLSHIADLCPDDIGPGKIIARRLSRFFAKKAEENKG